MLHKLIQKQLELGKKCETNNEEDIKETLDVCVELEEAITII